MPRHHIRTPHSVNRKRKINTQRETEKEGWPWSILPDTSAEEEINRVVMSVCLFVCFVFTVQRKSQTMPSGSSNYPWLHMPRTPMNALSNAGVLDRWGVGMWTPYVSCVPLNKSLMKSFITHSDYVKMAVHEGLSLYWKSYLSPFALPRTLRRCLPLTWRPLKSEKKPPRATLPGTSLGGFKAFLCSLVNICSPLFSLPCSNKNTSLVRGIRVCTFTGVTCARASPRVDLWEEKVCVLLGEKMLWVV